MTRFNRRAFLKKVGVATGTAVIASPVVDAVVEPGLVEASTSQPIPREPIVAIVRDAELGEVTVLSGTTEKTYRDRALVRRLLKAAEHNHASVRDSKGGA